jgi:DNA-binding NtrC family response regulator
MDILIIDDDDVVLRSCTRILESEGYNVTTATSVSDALDILNSRFFALMLVDIKMPEEDGISLILKARERGYMIPILVMSGYPTEETIRHSLASGAKGFIAKPFTPDELLEAVRNIIEGVQYG